mgnify:FL=1
MEQQSEIFKLVTSEKFINMLVESWIKIKKDEHEIMINSIFTKQEIINFKPKPLVL